MIKPHRAVAFLILCAYMTGFISPAFGAGLTSPLNPATQPPQAPPSDSKQPPATAPAVPGGPAPGAPASPPSAPAPSPPAPRPIEQFPSAIELSFGAPFSPEGQPGPSAPISRSLKQFGYNLFTMAPSTFAPILDIPVGPDYVLGPGDSLIINVFGLIEQDLKVTLDREGKIFLPKVGPVSLWGLTLSEAKALIEQELSRYFTKFQLAISMGTLRTIKVFVLGEAAQPGAYDVSAVSTLSNTLFVAGGPSKIGTLRHIQHIRKNQKIGEIDLYDLILRGNKEKDTRVESGDVIFIPTIGPVVGITGSIKRPAIYELSGKESLNDLIEMAGGITPLAYLERVQIERIRNHHDRILIDFDLVGPPHEPKAPELQDGDLVKIFSISGGVRDAVTLEGAVRHPGEYALVPNMRVSELLSSDQLLPESFLDRAELIRLKPDLTTEIIAFDIRKLIAGQSDQDLPLASGDRVVISTQLRKSASVTLGGEVQRPGSFTLYPGEHLSSVLRRAGGFTKNAYLPGALFIRKAVRDREEAELNAFMKVQEERMLAESSALAAGGVSSTDAQAEQQAVSQRRELLKVLAAKVTLGRIVVRLDQPDRLAGTPDDIALEDGDSLSIPQPPSSVVVLGSVRNSTGVLFKEGASLQYYLTQAGGPTEEANPKGIYVVKVDGSAVEDVSMGTRLDRGDAVIVPISTEAKYRPIPMWRDIATILGQTAITIAAIKVVF